MTDLKDFLDLSYLDEADPVVTILEEPVLVKLPAHNVITTLVKEESKSRAATLPQLELITELKTQTFTGRDFDCRLQWLECVCVCVCV